MTRRRRRNGNQRTSSHQRTMVTNRRETKILTKGRSRRKESLKTKHQRKGPTNQKAKHNHQRVRTRRSSHHVRVITMMRSLPRRNGIAELPLLCRDGDRETNRIDWISRLQFIYHPYNRRYSNIRMCLIIWVLQSRDVRMLKPNSERRAAPSRRRRYFHRFPTVSLFAEVVTAGS
jgi:hypothetical protein